MADTGDRSDPNRQNPGMVEIRTSDGNSVNRIEKGKYQILFPPMILKSADPNAP